MEVRFSAHGNEVLNGFDQRLSLSIRLSPPRREAFANLF
jgi:hypothetical protein